MALPVPSGLTPREYLAFDRASELRHEYVDGEVVAMSGATRRHNQIARNVVMALESGLRVAGKCEAYVSDLRVRVQEGRLYTYPDVVVACGDARFEDAEGDTLLDPTLVVEVLSPTTEAYDRGEKWERYRSLPTLRDYLLVAQDRPHVERFERRADGAWVFTESSGLDAVLVLASVGCELALADVYRRVELGVG